MRPNHEVRKSGKTEPSHRRFHREIIVVDAQWPVDLDLQTLSIVVKDPDVWFCLVGVEQAGEACELPGVFRTPDAFYQRRCGDYPTLGHTESASNKVVVIDRADSNRKVDSIRNQVHQLIGEIHARGDFGVSFQKIQQWLLEKSYAVTRRRRQPDMTAERFISLPDRFFRLFEQSVDRLRLLEQRVSGFGGLNAPSG